MHGVETAMAHGYLMRVHPRTLQDFAAEQLDAFTRECGEPNDRDQAIRRWMRYLIAVGQVPDDILEAMPEVSRNNEPQVSPQEYECGCVAVTRITDRNFLRDEKPFEMRLAIPCDTANCELMHPAEVTEREP
jgi:hypothetical protein